MEDPKNVEALSYGPDYMLGKFANLPCKPSDSKPAEEFEDRFGRLFPGVAPKDYCELVKGFRNAWRAKKPNELLAVGTYLEFIFNRVFCNHGMSETEWPDVLAGDPRWFPALKVDFSSGKISVTPHKTLLDWLAQSLLECRHRLGICEREGCATPYFVKAHPRARYCSEACFRASRLEKKNSWWKENRGKGTKRSPAKAAQKTRRKRGSQ
jgi:hypothetical protein